MQTAVSLSTLSAMHNNSGIEPNGSPLKSRSRPDAMTLFPCSASFLTTETISESKNCISSIATTSSSAQMWLNMSLAFFTVIASSHKPFLDSM